MKKRAVLFCFLTVLGLYGRRAQALPYFDYLGITSTAWECGQLAAQRGYQYYQYEYVDGRYIPQACFGENPITPPYPPPPPVTGSQWYSITVISGADRSECGRQVQYHISGFTCYRETKWSDYLACRDDYQHSRSEVNDALQNVNCVHKIFGPMSSIDTDIGPL
jgi:hypothetical protein